MRSTYRCPQPPLEMYTADALAGMNHVASGPKSQRLRDVSSRNGLLVIWRASLFSNDALSNCAMGAFPSRHTAFMREA